MVKPIIQILSNESVNSKGYRVINSSIDWTRYKKNPILLRNPENGEHYGEPIGKIINIRLKDGNWVGELVFGSSSLARQSKKDYEDGILNGVSIFGRARIAERDGKRYTVFFEIWEISLVNIPANPDAVAIRDERQALSAVSFECVESEDVVSLSATETELINQFENKMEENVKNYNTQEEQKDERVSLSALAQFLQKIGLASRERIAQDLDRDADQDDRDAGQDERDAYEDKKVAREARNDDDERYEERRKSEAERDDEDARRDEKMADRDRSEAREERESLNATFENEKNKLAGLSISGKANVYNIENQSNIKTKKNMVTPFFKYIEDPANAEKIATIAALSAPSKNDGGLMEIGLSAMENGETRTAICELAASMKADPYFMTSVENIYIDVNGGRKVSASETIESLASGEGSAQFVQNADLAKVVWLSLFVRQLFPSNTWADRVRRLSVRDKAGIIWIQSAINPDIYFGDRAPLNAPNYLYDDLPRGLSRKVFSMQPIVWQSANSDILSYNDRATGTMEAMAKMTTAIHNYWLQVIAESVPVANQIPMSGTTFNAAGRFPINSAATGSLKGMTVNDLLSAQGRFIARNLTFRRGSGVAVLAEPYFTSLQQTDEIKSILTQQLSNARPDGFTYSGFDVLARSVIAAYNTTSNTVVDAETYFDKPVDFATGAIDEQHTKPVLTATTYDIGLGFMPEEVVVAIGNTNIHMVSDPNNYGWKMSMDVSTGAGTLRSSALGIVLYRPTTA